MNDHEIVDRAKTLAEIAPDDSVTTAILSGRESQFSTVTPLCDPPVTYFEPTESPAYVLTNRKRGIGRVAKRNTVSPDGDKRTIVLVTGRRTLCLVGQSETDVSIEIPHESVASVTVKTGFRAHRLTLSTPRKRYHCWVHRKTDTDRLEDAASFVEQRQQDEPAEIEDGDEANTVMYRGRPVSSEPDGPAESTQTVRYRGRPVDDSE